MELPNFLNPNPPSSFKGIVETKTDGKYTETVNGKLKIKPDEVVVPWIPVMEIITGYASDIEVTGSPIDTNFGYTKFCIRILDDGGPVCRIYDIDLNDFYVDKTNIQLDEIISWNGLIFTIKKLPNPDLGTESEFHFYIYPTPQQTIQFTGTGTNDLTITGSYAEDPSPELIKDTGIVLTLEVIDGGGSNLLNVIADSNNGVMIDLGLSTGYPAEMYGYWFDVDLTGSVIGDTYKVTIYPNNPSDTIVAGDGLVITKMVNEVETEVFKINSDGEIYQNGVKQSLTGIVTQDYNLIADVNTITLPASVTGEFIYQIFEVDGTSLIPQPNIQMYYDGTDWKIDLTGASAITIKIKFLKA